MAGVTGPDFVFTLAVSEALCLYMEKAEFGLGRRRACVSDTLRRCAWMAARWPPQGGEDDRGGDTEISFSVAG